MIRQFSQFNLGSVEHVWVEYLVAESKSDAQIFVGAGLLLKKMFALYKPKNMGRMRSRIMYLLLTTCFAVHGLIDFCWTKINDLYCYASLENQFNRAELEAENYGNWSLAFCDTVSLNKK
jgi:hypothetical protein